MIQARLILGELKKAGVTHVLNVPDNSSKSLLTLLRTDGALRVISVTREGEAFAIAAGLWVGGKIPIVLIQNTGLLETGDALRGTVMRMRVPLVCLITYRGYAKWAASGLEASARALNPELLSRADLDSVAVLTEPTLKAWAIPYAFVRADSDLPRIPEAFDQARRLEQPVAVLITSDTT